MFLIVRSGLSFISPPKKSEILPPSVDSSPWVLTEPLKRDIPYEGEESIKQCHS